MQSGERNGTPSRRSKSEGPPLANGRCVKMENVSEVKQIKEKVFWFFLSFAQCNFIFCISSTSSFSKYSLFHVCLHVLAWWYRACLRAYNLKRLWFYRVDFLRMRKFTFHLAWCKWILHRSTHSLYFVHKIFLHYFTFCFFVLLSTTPIISCVDVDTFVSHMEWDSHVPPHSFVSSNKLEYLEQKK